MLAGNRWVPRLPAKEASGSRMGWSQFDRRALRKWLMPVQAKALGLEPLKAWDGRGQNVSGNESG